MSNNDDTPRRNRDRPEDNPFIAFRRFADSQVSSLMNTVFTLPATIANYNNVHQAREACLFKKADKTQCNMLQHIEDEITVLRHEGRELYRVGDLQEVLKKSEELMRLDRQADELRRNIVDQSSHMSSNEDDKELVHRFANRKGQEWGWDWSWGSPKPFDDDSHPSQPTTDGRHGPPSSYEQQRELYEQMMADARSIFGEDAWDETMSTVVRALDEYPALRALVNETGYKDFVNSIHKHPTEASSISSKTRYSPHALDQDEEMKKTGVNWRAAYEDLVRAERQENESTTCPVRNRAMFPKRVLWADETTSDEPSYEYSHDHEDQHDDPPTPRMRQEGFAPLQAEPRRPTACDAARDDADINKFLQEQHEMEGRRLGLRGPTAACNSAWEDGDINEYLREEQEQNGRYLGLRTSAQSGDQEDSATETELDAYEHLLTKPKTTKPTPAPGSTTSKEVQPSILSTLTTTERTVAPDGSVTTKVVLKKRFADGREESSETVHTQRGQEQDQVRDPWAAVHKAFAPQDSKKDEGKEKEKKKSGWFWALTSASGSPVAPHHDHPQPTPSSIFSIMALNTGLDTQSSQLKTQDHRQLAAVHLRSSARHGKRWQETELEACELRSHISNLQKQLRKLDDESNSLAEKIGTSERFAHNHLIAIGQPECHSLCENMYDKLPRELRDMVYHYLLDDAFGSTMVTIASKVTGCCVKNKESNQAFYPKPHKCSNGICAMQFMDTTFMGGLVRNKIVETWLARSTFSLCSGWRYLADLLNSDRWNIGAPAHHFINWLDVRIDYETVYHSGDMDFSTLEALALLRPVAEVGLCLDFSICYVDRPILIRSFEYMLEMLWKYFFIGYGAT
ncbi:hypothetical protein CC86DRAFT_455514 [Ophiobolus disseminans]|uniref:Uncharacterized protein n=1 Tax=Ophiobolus disseminans TaxID=1469910 RepID=A0A6A7A2W6_9PLEO|nr:hypothetical protein CC86DRAFT_455514 [Ophiobolus disseminans]